MVINIIGKYTVKEETPTGTIVLFKGDVFTVTEVDAARQRVYSPEFGDWLHWDKEVTPYKEPKKKRGDKKLTPIRKVNS